jgi:hypothetical protein
MKRAGCILTILLFFMLPISAQEVQVKDDQYDDLMKALITLNVIANITDTAQTLYAKNKYPETFVEFDPMANFFLQKGDGAFIAYKAAWTVLLNWSNWELYKRNKHWGLVMGVGHMSLSMNIIIWNFGQSKR